MVEQYTSEVNTTNVEPSIISNNESNNSENTENSPINPQPVLPKPEPPVETEPVVPTQPQDVFEPLKNKYSKEQIWVIRKMFKSLSDNCPKGQLPLIEDLKKLAIKDFLK